MVDSGKSERFQAFVANHIGEIQMHTAPVPVAARSHGSKIQQTRALEEPVC